MLKKICIVIIGICLAMASSLCAYRYYNYGTFFAKKITIDRNNWKTVLINNEYYLDKEYKPKCVKLANGVKVSKRIYPHLQSMFDDARKQGISITVGSGYRSWEEQNELWEEEMNRLDEKGVSLHDAVKRGELVVQRPGMSEHQTGLAVDINSMQSDASILYKWLKDNSYKYGFILRFPKEKKKITGIIYEPWHFRYVGKEAGASMKIEYLFLEEYVKRN